MDQIRDRANRFMERYLDFYLYEVLRTVPDPGCPNRAILLFQASGQGQKARVEKRVSFYPGGREYHPGSRCTGQTMILA